MSQHKHRKSKYIVDLRHAVPGVNITRKNQVDDVSLHYHRIVSVNHPVARPSFSHVQSEYIPEHIVVKQKRKFKQRKVTTPKTGIFHNIIFQFKGAIQFVALTATIFILLFGLSNFTAYKSIVEYWYNTEVIKAEKQETALDSLVKPMDKRGTDSLIFNEGKIKYVNFQVRPSDSRIYISKINRNLPIVHTNDAYLNNKNWDGLEKQIQEDLKKGVVHYPGTAKAGNVGNMFLTSHSSWYYPLKYGLGTAFALIDKLVAGDDIYIFDEGNMYIYRVRDKFVVKPSAVSVLDQPSDKRELTLMTCTPIGTSLNRLIVKADLIYPVIDEKTQNVDENFIPNPYSDSRLQA